MIEQALPDTGLLRVVSPAALTETERQKALQTAEENNNKPVLQGIAAYIMDCWESARDVKRTGGSNGVGVNDRLLKAQLARLGKYDTVKLSAIKTQTGGSEEYARVTANKCRVAEAWLRDVYLGQTEKPWTLKATPVPDMPPEEMARIKQTVAAEVAQVFAVFHAPPPSSMIQDRVSELQDATMERMRDEARRAVERMERKIYDQLVEGGWDLEWGKFLNDLVTYPAAHFKGPVLRQRQNIKWVQNGSRWMPKVEKTVTPEFMRIDPFRCYPSPNATTPQEGYFIEHVTFSRDDLYNLIGFDGYSEEAIRAVLEEYGAHGLVDWMGLSSVEQEEYVYDGQDRDRGPVVDIDCIEFHGPVRGKDLVEWGMDAKEIDDIDADYEACVWMIGRWVIKAQLNYDPTKTRPYFKSSWEELPGSYWGLGLADTLEDVQGVVNAAVRSLVNNMAMASGPQVAVNVDRMPAGEDISTLTPWKIWQMQDSQYGSTSAAIDFFQPNSNVQELLTVIEKFYQFADDWSLIPRYMSGNDRVGGAGRTASGLSMLLNAANKGLKGVVSNIDTNVLTPLLNKQYMFNMLFDDDETMKGDAEVVAKGAVSLMQLESLQLRRNEFLSATANPLDSQIVGLEGRAEILREVAKGLEMDVNRVVPPRGSLSQIGMPGQPQGQPGSLPAPNQEQLMNGAAVTDNFSPNTMRGTS